MAERRPRAVTPVYRINPMDLEDLPPPQDDRKRRQQSDFIDDIQRGLGSMLAGAGSAVRDIDEGAGQWMQSWGNEVVANYPADYTSTSQINGLGDVVGFGFERLMEMTPQFGIAAAGALIRVPPQATMGATTALTTYGEAREAQREAGKYDPLKAALAAAGAGALDTFGVAKLLPGRGSILKDITEGGFKGIVKQGAKTGIEEAGTEVAQKALQRYGGGQELMSPEAIEEYKFSALAGGLIGGGLGGIAGGVAPSFNTPSELPPEAGAAPTSLPPAPPAPRSSPAVDIPPGLADAPAIRTIEISDPTAPEEGVTGSLEVLSEPDEAGNVWVRTPDGIVTPMKQATLSLMGDVVAAPAVAEVPVEAPAVVPPVETGVVETGVTAPSPAIEAPAVTALPPVETGFVAPPQPLPIGMPIDVTAPDIPAPVMNEPAPVEISAPPEMTAPAPPEMAAPAPVEVSAPPVMDAPVTPQATGAAPEPVAAPVPPVMTQPEPMPEVPVDTPTEPQPAPEQYVFTREKAEEVGGHDPQLAQDLVGTTVSGASRLLAQRTKSPLYKQLATRVAGVAQAMESAGIRMPVGVTAVKGGAGATTPWTMHKAAKPSTGGVTSSYSLPGGGYRAIEVAMRGKPSPTVPRGANERTLMHELLHSVTTGIQRNPDKFADTSRVGQAVKQAKALQREVERGALQIKNGTLKVSDDVKASLARLERTNAFQNERELIAWGLTDYDMQNVLRAIPVKNGNAFTEFVRIIARMVGIGEKDLNALRELIEITDAIIPTDAGGISEVVDVVTGKVAEPVVEPEMDQEGISLTKKVVGDETIYVQPNGSRIAVMENSRWSPRPNSITDFVVPEELRGNGEGGRLLNKIIDIYGADTISAAASSEPSVRAFYKRGFRPVGEPNATIEDALRIRQEDSSVTMVTPRKAVEPEVDSEVDTEPTLATNEEGRPYIQYGKGDESRAEFLKRVWVNKMRRLGYVEEAIAKSLGKPLSRAERPSEKAALFEGRTDTRLNELNRDHINKIIEALKKEGVRPQDLDLFLVAMAAPARNAKIAERNPKMPDGGSGMTNAMARQVIIDVANRGDLPRMERLADMVYGMTKATRERMVEYGLLSRKQAKALEEAEPFYVPLKGGSIDGDMSTAGEEVFSAPGSGRGFSVTRKEYLAAKGRYSLPFSPLATAMNDAQDAIIRGERNRVGQSFLNDIAKKYDSDAWMVFTDENPDMTTQYVRKYNQNRTVPVNMAANSKEYFIVKENGKPYYIKINDPILLRALTNGSTKDFSSINKFLGNTIGVATRALSQLHTTLNPEFFIPNVVRDIEAATFNILAEQDAVDGRIAGKKIVKGVIKDISDRQNWKRLFKATFNHEATTAEQQQMNALFQQAKEDGAFTGWILYTTPEEHMAAIKRELEKVTATGGKKAWYSTIDGARYVMDKIQDFNSVFENITRLAVYKNALAAGVTRDEAANMARNVTVDFNRKGEAGPTANAFYAFFNASIQGNVQLLRSLTAKTASGKSTRAQKMAIGMIGLGMLMATAGRGMSDEDEDGMLFYDKIPDWEKERNMIIMLPDGREYLKIPMPYGYSFFHNGGANFVDLLQGKKTMGDFAVSTFSGLLNNFSPLPLNLNSAKGALASTLPTALRPIGDLAINENFFGSPIYNEPFDENQAQSSVSRYSTPQGYKAVVEFLNELTGGKGKVAGIIDLPAESIEYLLQYYVGSAGKFLGKTWDWGASMASGREVAAKDWPVFSKVLGEPNKQNDLGLYYDRLNAINPVQAQLRDSTGEDRILLREKFPVETNPRVVNALKAAQKQLKDANKAKSLLLSRDLDSEEKQERLDKLDERIHNTYLNFNRVYNQVKERSHSQEIQRYRNGGVVRPGNIDIHNRPVVHNPDGSISTVRSITVGFDDGVYVLPTVVDDRIVTNDEAIQHFRKTGQHLGVFRTKKEAEEYSQALHKQQEREYVKEREE